MTKKMKINAFVVIVNYLLINLLRTGYSFSNILDLEFQIEPLTVMVTPQDGKVIFRCLASPSSAIISWLWNGELLMQNADSRFHVGQHRLVVSLPKKNKDNIKSFDGSEVRCKAHYRKRTLISLPAKLIIGRLDPFPEHDDIHITALTGNLVVIPCKPPPSVPIAVTEFEFNDIIISRSTAHYQLMPSGNLQIFGASFNDTGSYRCKVFNPFLNEKKVGRHKITLSVNDSHRQHQPIFLSTPKNITNVVMGSNVTLECASSGFPFPNITWEKENGRLPRGRHVQIGGNLLLFNVLQEDQGKYTCHVENGVGEAIFASTLLSFQEIPQLSSLLDDHQVMKGDNITVECVAKGHPKPEITWYHNGKRLVTNSRIHVKDGTVVIKKTLAKDSGIYQCFASNELGATYGVFVIEVTDSANFPIEWNQEDDDNKTLIEGHNIYQDSLGENKGPKKRKHKGVKMVPPSKPEVTRLSDNSAMVRWDVPQNDGLPILFFRVQYKEVGRKGGQWKTIDEDIASHLHAHAVTGLKTGGRYRFRIAAVYANHDNKLGPSSAKFILHKDPPSKRPEIGPTIVLAEAVSPSAITLHWEYSEVDTIPIEGFFIYYRETHSAGEYLQVTVLGSNTRSHILSHLLPDNSYDIKMQCFNLYGTSDFSNIYTCKTFQPIRPVGYNNKPQEDWSSTNTGNSIGVSSKSDENSKLIYIILASVLGVMLLILSVFIVLCIRRQHRHRQPLPNAPVALELQIKPEMNGHVSAGNGYLKGKEKVNISVNPLGEYIKEEATKLNRSLEIPCNNNEETALRNMGRETRQQCSQMETYIENNAPEKLENNSESSPMLLPNGERNEKDDDVAPG